jgi:hypothetical protein
MSGPPRPRSRPRSGSGDGSDEGGGLLGDDRGQTLQDYAAGIGVFLLAVAFVLALVPTVFSPYESPIESDQTAQSERLTEDIGGELSDGGVRGALNYSAATELFSPVAGPTDEDDLRARYELRPEVQVNVSLLTPTRRARQLCPGAPEPPGVVGRTSGCAVGTPVGDNPVAVSVSVFRDGGTFCRPSCRLQVRVW